MKAAPVLNLPMPPVTTAVRNSHIALARGMLTELRDLTRVPGLQREVLATRSDDDRKVKPVKSRFIERAKDAID